MADGEDEHHPIMNLPKFANPPVVETVLGVQFRKLAEFRNAHLGAFWKTLGEDWPNVSDASPLAHVQERFGDDRWVRSGPMVRLSQDVPSRLWIRNKSRDRMIQVQNDRLCYNWLSIEGKSSYPSYGDVRPRFDETWELFRRFLAAENFDPPQPDQWEITYVNHIPRGGVWNQPADIRRLLPGIFSKKANAVWGVFESAGGAFTFEIPDRRGRLHVEVQHTQHNEPNPTELIVLKLTARGPIDDNTDLNAGLNLGHETIVQAFTDLTAEKAHAPGYWNRIDNG